MQTIAKLTVPQLETLIERVIERKMLELFADPDRGLELKNDCLNEKMRRARVGNIEYRVAECSRTQPTN
ncbi:MAG: hypothetical protein HZC40_11450 [Chloroflexi bacterium]|nr:hypothetical protein [Chloroflexota bacterium]